MGALSDPIQKVIKAELPRATRAALEATFYYWLNGRAPDHFERVAFAKYPAAYRESAKLDAEQWRRRHSWQIKRGLKRAAAAPLRETGRLRAAFLTGTVRFTGSMTRLRATWPSLPAYATRTNRYSGFNTARALVDVSQEDAEAMAAVFKAWVVEHLIRYYRAAPPTRGRIVIEL